jgi:Rv0078B-related antitoxin
MTPEEGLEKQIELYRAMTPQQRLQISFELYEMSRMLVKQGVRHQHPDWDNEQVEQEVARRCRLAAGIP